MSERRSSPVSQSSRFFFKRERCKRLNRFWRTELQPVVARVCHLRPKTLFVCVESWPARAVCKPAGETTLARELPTLQAWPWPSQWPSRRALCDRSRISSPARREASSVALQKWHACCWRAREQLARQISSSSSEQTSLACSFKWSLDKLLACNLILNLDFTQKLARKPSRAH